MATTRLLLWILSMAAVGLSATGCGTDGMASKVVFGTITHQGRPVETGTVRFVPIDDTKGPASFSLITDGQYRIDARGGVPLGKHRVEVDARKTTGRKIQGHNGFEIAEVDESVRLGSPLYATDRSPLMYEVTAQSDGRIDIDIP